jgi:hypothetical protein
VAVAISPTCPSSDADWVWGENVETALEASRGERREARRGVVAVAISPTRPSSDAGWGWGENVDAALEALCVVTVAISQTRSAAARAGFRRE